MSGSLPAVSLAGSPQSARHPAVAIDNQRKGQLRLSLDLDLS